MELKITFMILKIRFKNQIIWNTLEVYTECKQTLMVVQVQ